MKAVHAEQVRIAWIAKAEGGSSLAIENAKEGFGEKRRRRQPGKLPADAPQSVRAEGAGEDQGVVHEGPLVWVLGVLSAEFGQELAGFELQVGRQRHALQVSLLQLHSSLVVLVELENKIGEAFEIGVHRAIKHDFGVDE